MNTKRTIPSHWPKYCTDEYYDFMMRDIPPGAIVADWSKHVPHNSYSPLFWYDDVEVKCADCGKQFTFTKEEQRTWYEEYKIPIQVQCTRCANCRRAVREGKASQKAHMEELGKIPPHPNEVFFKKPKT